MDYASEERATQPWETQTKIKLGQLSAMTSWEGDRLIKLKEGRN